MPHMSAPVIGKLCTKRKLSLHMKCPNCYHKFSLWSSLKLSNLFRVQCSQCHHEIVKDTGAFQSLYPGLLSVVCAMFLCWVTLGSFSLWVFVYLFPLQVFFDNHYATLRSLGHSGKTQN